MTTNTNNELFFLEKIKIFTFPEHVLREINLVLSSFIKLVLQRDTYSNNYNSHITIKTVK